MPIWRGDLRNRGQEQIAAIIPVITEAMAEAGVGRDEIEAVAVTQGPGLIGSLLIGVETAKALALAWKKPLIAVNHMMAHVFALDKEWEMRWFRNYRQWRSSFGGHTDIMLLNSLTDWKWIGGTRDDAAGRRLIKRLGQWDSPIRVDRWWQSGWGSEYWFAYRNEIAPADDL